MTTIAWDGEIIAADTLVTHGTMRMMKMNKIKVIETPLNTFYIACTGALPAIKTFENKIKENHDWRGNISDFSNESQGGLRAILISKRKCSDESVINNIRIWLFEIGGDAIEFDKSSKIAIGSGQDFAFAALNLGRNAIEAVELASRLDVYTGYEISSFIVG